MVINFDENVRRDREFIYYSISFCDQDLYYYRCILKGINYNCQLLKKYYLLVSQNKLLLSYDIRFIPIPKAGGIFRMDIAKIIGFIRGVIGIAVALIFNGGDFNDFLDDTFERGTGNR